MRTARTIAFLAALLAARDAGADNIPPTSYFNGAGTRVCSAFNVQAPTGWTGSCSAGKITWTGAAVAGGQNVAARLTGNGSVATPLDMATGFAIASCGDATHVGVITVDTWGRVSGCAATAITGLAAGSIIGTAVVNADSRLAPSPTAAGKQLYDTGAGYAETAACGANTLLHGNGASAPTCSAIVAADAPTLAPLASPTFTGTVSLPTVTMTGDVTTNDTATSIRSAAAKVLRFTTGIANGSGRAVDWLDGDGFRFFDFYLNASQVFLESYRADNGVQLGYISWDTNAITVNNTGAVFRPSASNTYTNGDATHLWSTGYYGTSVITPTVGTDVSNQHALPSGTAALIVQSEIHFSAYNSANLASSTAFAQTVVTNASTLVTGSTMVHDVAGTGTGTFVAKLCSDGVTCGAGNVYLTCTSGATCAAAVAGRIDACTITKSAVSASTTLTWSVGTACGTTDPGVNVVAHMTTP